MRILIVHDHVDGSSRKDEADALVQARVVGTALTELGHEWMTLGLTLDLDCARQAIEQIRPHAIFNLVECLAGHGRLIHVAPGLFESLRIPFTGAAAEAQFATSNKLVAKRMMSSAGIPTPAWFDDGSDDLAPLAAERCIIKSVWEHASVGLDEDSVVTADSPQAVRQAISARADQLGGEGFAERYIDGREFNLAILAGPEGPQILPPAEIVFEGYQGGKPKVVGWRAKWEADSFEYNNTPRRYEFSAEDAELIDRLRTIAVRCWRLFALRGYARVDFRVDEERHPWVLEVNTNPCLSPDAGFAAALERAGIPFRRAVERILNDALSASRSRTPSLT